MTKQELIDLLKASPSSNGGTAPGVRVFLRENGLSQAHLNAAGVRYAELCSAADLKPNSLQRKLDPDKVISAVASLAEEIQRFPNTTDWEFARSKDPEFPSYEAIKRLERDKGPIFELIVLWCDAHGAHPEARALAAAHASQLPEENDGHEVCAVSGYVYLFRYGKGGSMYKVGMSDNPDRRHAQLASMYPGVLKHVHRIETDDPRGIEAYWHKRFEQFRVPGKKEVFRLGNKEVAAFRSRKSM